MSFHEFELNGEKSRRAPGLRYLESLGKQPQKLVKGVGKERLRLLFFNFFFKKILTYSKKNEIVVGFI